MSFKLACGDCLEVMKRIPDKSVDMILCDLPYGTTACKWDSVIDPLRLWSAYRRVRKENAAIVLTANQPFTSKLITSAIDEFKYSWVWVKTNCSGFANAKKQPLRSFEDVLVFYASQPTYNPQGTVRLEAPRIRTKETGDFMGRTGFKDGYQQEVTNYPKNVLNIPSATKTVHPTQKPVALMEYLIKTYTNEGDTVLDNCMGSGTTGVACINLKRNFKGIEKDPKYFQIAKERIEAAAAAAEREAANVIKAGSTEGGDSTTDSSIGGVAGETQSIGQVSSDPSIQTEGSVDEGSFEGLGTGVGTVRQGLGDEA